VQAGIEAAKTVHALHHPTLKLVVDVHKAAQIAGVPELMRSKGFRPVRHHQRVEHPLTDLPPAPPSPRIEAWSPQSDEDFRFVRNESYADYWSAVPMPADQWRNRITNQTFQRDLSFLMRDAGGAAGDHELGGRHRGHRHP
jgi:hypothetical protein